MRGKKCNGPCWTQASARESRSCLEQASDGVCHGEWGAAGNGASLCLSGLASPWQGFWKTRHPKSDTFPYIPPPSPASSNLHVANGQTETFFFNNMRIWSQYMFIPELPGLKYTHKSSFPCEALCYIFTPSDA